MKRLISIELQKLWQSKASRILIISYFVLLSFIALISSIEINIFGHNVRFADQGLFNFPFIWHFNTYVAVYFKIFLAIVIVSMMANEYTYGTLKQNLIDGLSKQEFLGSKVAIVLLFSVVSTLFVFIMTLILGYSFSSYTEASIVFRDLQYLLAYFINLVAFFSFCLFAGVLVKRSAFALGFIILWSIIENILYAILRWQVFGGDEALTHKVVAFFPLESISNLLIEPLNRFKTVKAVNAMAGQVIDKDFGVHWYSILIVLVWTSVFLWASYRILKKRDL